MNNQNSFDSRLTIGQIVELYKDPQKRYKYIEEIETRIAAANSQEVTFLNDNYLNALCLSHVMFERTTFNLSIISGTNILDFLRSLKEPFGEAARAIDSFSRDARGAILKGIRILVLAPYTFQDDESLIKGLKEFEPLIDVKIKTPQPNITLHHAMISDSRDYRLEALHNEITQDSNAGEIHAKVVFNGRKASWLQNQFDVLFESNSLQYFLKRG